MKPILHILLFSCLLYASCNQPSTQGDLSAKDGPVLNTEKIMGIYSGRFDKGLITLVINYISGKNVSGYNMHKGLRRNINGTVTTADGQLQFVLKEPGDNPFDGTFYFSLDTTTLKINGRWIPFDSSKTTAKTMALARRKQWKDLDSEYVYEWQTPTSRDTSLLFNDDGSCEYAFYERPGDSTSQVITIRGTYEQEKDTAFKIEWQKNTHTPAQAMKLIKTTTYIKDSTSNESYPHTVLKGHGWELIPFEGG